MIWLVLAHVRPALNSDFKCVMLANLVDGITIEQVMVAASLRELDYVTAYSYTAVRRSAHAKIIRHSIELQDSLNKCKSLTHTNLLSRQLESSSDIDEYIKTCKNAGSATYRYLDKLKQHQSIFAREFHEEFSIDQK